VQRERRDVLSADDRDRFVELERKHIAENTPGWRWCMNPSCRAGQVHASPQTQNVSSRTSAGRKKKRLGTSHTAQAASDVCECHECHHKVCVPCDRPYHEGETCEAYQARIKDRFGEEDLSLKALKALSKPCPNCKKLIEKDGGCSIMWCMYPWTPLHLLLTSLRYTMLQKLLLDMLVVV
jgi:hypothetical protein